MSRKVGISGTGRIGRLLIRKLLSSERGSVQLEAINSKYPAETIAHLLKYDTVHGQWDADISVVDGDLLINGSLIRMYSENDPAHIPWRSAGVEIAIDATGKFTDRAGAAKHLAAGASKVIVTAPGKQMDLTVVMGVNDHLLDSDKHTILSAASCTTNCVAPLLYVLDLAFQVERGWMTTVHSYTSDQNHLDNPHKDLRRARACTQSIVPTSTGVGAALRDVLPHLATRVEGLSVRVPTQNVSLVDLTVEVSKEVTPADVRRAFLHSKEILSRYIGFTDEPLVSSDYIGCEQSATVDGLSIMASGKQLKLLAWYDNEWAYSCRVLDLAEAVSDRMAPVRTGRWAI